MTSPGTPKASQAAITAVQEALLAEGAGPGNSIHSWRCEHPDRYGPCDCVLEVARAAADAAAPHNAAQALRDAAEEIQRQGTATTSAESVRTWLRMRAHRIESSQ